jgi:hypothetical protein
VIPTNLKQIFINVPFTLKNEKFYFIRSYIQ